MSAGGIIGLIILVLVVVIAVLSKNINEQNQEAQKKNARDAEIAHEQQRILDKKISERLEKYKQTWAKYKDYEAGRLLYLVKSYTQRKGISNILKEPENITKAQFKQMIDSQLEYDEAHTKYNISDK